MTAPQVHKVLAPLHRHDQHQRSDEEYKRKTKNKFIWLTVYNLSKEHVTLTPSLSSRWCLAMIIALLFHTSVPLPKRSAS
ncbi:uncharacterized protein [Aegilops tauschii subsp. strangulata]|uniref:uncharacterized protein n=1 Tax=Aegilops tauschii subsp. strangulata TaxID=200361 RepID=UPI003CC8A594